VRTPASRRALALAALGVAFAGFVLYGGNAGGPVTPYRAPALVQDPARWLNGPPALLDGGRVSLVEAWSYG
jgi:hypothetical protein